MILDTLHPEVRDALVSCCSIEAFDREQFNSVVAEYRLEDLAAALVDEVYRVVVFADCERQRDERRTLKRELRRVLRRRRNGVEPCLN